MRAMVLHTPGQPLQREDRPIPAPSANQLLIKVLACGVCRTDSHLVDDELPQAVLPRVPGHEIARPERKSGWHQAGAEEAQLLVLAHDLPLLG